MNASLQKALYQLTGHEDIDTVSVSDLEKLVDTHPWFAVAQVLLAAKRKAMGSPDFIQQLQKTTLYLNNPLWLHYQLSKDSYAGEELENKGMIEEMQVVPDQFHPDSEIIQEEIESGDKPALQKAFHDEKVESDTYTSTHFPSLQPAASHANLPLLETQILEINIEDDEQSIEVPNPVSVSEEELEKDEDLLQQISHPEEVSDTNGTQTNTGDIKGSINTPNTSLEDRVSTALEGHNAFAKEIEERTQALVNPPDPSNPNEQHLVPYEPYHTIDYFASQGIKLILEKDPQDKLGKQLKSFTQWLKHMKRLGPEDALNSVKETHLETTIQGIADSSNIPRDIVTETMAQVLEKQGKNDKAIQLYIKLSFLNPDKSAYFAGKIQKLKGI